MCVCVQCVVTVYCCESSLQYTVMLVEDNFCGVIESFYSLHVLSYRGNTMHDVPVHAWVPTGAPEEVIF